MTPQAALKLRSISLREANRFLAIVDNRQGPVRRHKFAIALKGQDGALQGVAIAGPPSTRSLDTGWRLEILLVATDGTPQAESTLYEAAARTGEAIGYRRCDILTHTRATDSDTALREAGWVPIAEAPGTSPRYPGRPPAANRPTGGRTIRWHAAQPSIPATTSESAA
jgi:hypothetical protein